MDKLKDYEKNYKKYINGEITEKEWVKIADEYFDELLRINQEIFQRLKFS